MVGSGEGRFVVAARRRRYLTLVSGSAPFVVPLTVGTLAFRAIGVGHPIWRFRAGGAIDGQGRGNRVEMGVVGQRSVW